MAIRKNFRVAMMLALVVILLGGLTVFLVEGKTASPSSAAATPVTMPNLLGMTSSQAQSELATLYETNFSSTSQEVTSLVSVVNSPASYDSSFADGNVIQQEPMIGFKLTGTTPVNLLIGYEGYPLGGAQTPPTGEPVHVAN